MASGPPDDNSRPWVPPNFDARHIHTPAVDVHHAPALRQDIESGSVIWDPAQNPAQSDTLLVPRQLVDPVWDPTTRLSVSTYSSSSVVDTALDEPPARLRQDPVADGSPHHPTHHHRDSRVPQPAKHIRRLRGRRPGVAQDSPNATFWLPAEKTGGRGHPRAAQMRAAAVAAARDEAERARVAEQTSHAVIEPFEPVDAESPSEGPSATKRDLSLPDPAVARPPSSRASGRASARLRSSSQRLVNDPKDGSQRLSAVRQSKSTLGSGYLSRDSITFDDEHTMEQLRRFDEESAEQRRQSTWKTPPDANGKVFQDSPITPENSRNRSTDGPQSGGTHHSRGTHGSVTSPRDNSQRLNVENPSSPGSSQVTGWTNWFRRSRNQSSGWGPIFRSSGTESASPQTFLRSIFGYSAQDTPPAKAPLASESDVIRAGSAVVEENKMDYEAFEEDSTVLDPQMIKVSILLDKDEKHFFQLKLLKEADRLACINWLIENFSWPELDRAARRLDLPIKNIASRTQRRNLTHRELEDLLAYHQRIQAVAEAMTVMRIRDAECDVLRTTLKEDATNAAVLEPPDLSQQLTMLGRNPDPRHAPRFIQFEDLYQKHSLIGRGRTGEVWLAYRKNANNVDLAVRVLKKGPSGSSNMDSIEHLRVREEVEITKLLHHPNVIRTHDYFDHGNDHVYIVMDLMKGGTLLETLQRSSATYTEAIARDIMRRVLRGVSYIHDEGIIHRDIRPGNILCSRARLPCEIKISDFGFAHDIVDRADQGGYRETNSSSGLYHSPEVVRREELGPEIDVWACGVLLYFLLTGEHPFVGRNVRQTHEKIATQPVRFRGNRWRRLSESSQHLCRMMLQKDGHRRIEARDALDHPWFKLQVGELTSSLLEVDWEFARYEMEKEERSVGLEILEMWGLREDVPGL